MRITLDLIENASAFTNALDERELDLRGHKFAAIENLSSTRDLFDTIDLSYNEIRRLENFPPLNRLKTLFLSNNKIIKIDPSLAQKIPYLKILDLSSNELAELNDLLPLASWSLLASAPSKITYRPQLEGLSLIDNPCTKKPNYRMFVISLVPSLRVLDYQKITEKERKLSTNMLNEGLFKIAIDSDLLIKTDYSREKQELIRASISKAKTLSEIRYLEQALASGVIPENPGVHE